GVNIVTGHYSRGAAGCWVEQGQIQFPVSEITVAANLQDMFLNVRGVCDDIDARGNVQVGSILIDSMTVAGKSTGS
ncbi:MAG: metallopeptidase TldD-related protein, partial [Ketobacter sp.]